MHPTPHGSICKDPKTPRKLQIALQGGGAKLFALLAAMEAVQKLQRDGTLEVTRVAGSSAGSIAACLFAARVELSKVRERLKAHPRNSWDKHFPSNRWNAIWKLARGRSLWSDDLLRKDIEYFFKEQGVQTLKDIEKKFGILPIVIATDLSQGKKLVYKEDETITKAILDSCAIPFCFRVWNRSGNPVIVDGGISDNLPSEELEPNEDAYGPVVAISFDEPYETPVDSFATFAYSLIGTSINHSIYRTKRRLGAERVFNIQTSIGTFDFPKAFSDESDTEYSIIRKEAHDFFERLTLPTSTGLIEVASEEWEAQSKEYMAKMNKIYESQHVKQKLKYLKCRVEVKIGSLEESPASDFVRYAFSFRTLNSAIYCHQLALSKADEDYFLKTAEFSVYNDASGKTVDVIYLPIEGENPNGQLPKKILIFFIPELEPESGPYTLECTDTIHGFLGPLRERGKDILRVTPFRAAETIDDLEIVLHLPYSTSITMYQHKRLGEKMSEADINRGNFGKHQGYKRIGWKASELPADQPFELELIRD